MELLIIQFPPVSCNLVPPWPPRNPPQDIILQNSQLMLFPVFVGAKVLYQDQRMYNVVSVFINLYIFGYQRERRPVPVAARSKA